MKLEKMKSVGLGEREIIRRLARKFSQSEQKLPLGFEDDVSVYPTSRTSWLVLKTDTLVGSTDVPPGMTLEQASRKAVVATVSDFASKGVRPSGLLLSLALRPPVTPHMVKELSDGIYKASKEYGCRVIGGDTGEASDLIIDCVGFGFVSPKMILRRNGARPGDVIAVTGSFGRTSAGLRILLSRKKVGGRFSRLVDSVLRPAARLDTGLRLAKSGAVTSSIDSSDGLAWSLHEIASTSGVSMLLDKVPLAEDAKLYARLHGLQAENLALYGGEEYELLVTIRKGAFPALKKMVPSLIQIGSVAKGDNRVKLVSEDGEEPIEPRGWEHMVSRD